MSGIGVRARRMNTSNLITNSHLNSSFRKHPKPLHVATSAVYVTVILMSFLFLRFSHWKLLGNQLRVNRQTLATQYARSGTWDCDWTGTRRYALILCVGCNSSAASNRLQSAKLQIKHSPQPNPFHFRLPPQFIFTEKYREHIFKFDVCFFFVLLCFNLSLFQCYRALIQSFRFISLVCTCVAWKFHSFKKKIQNDRISLRSHLHLLRSSPFSIVAHSIWNTSICKILNDRLRAL